MARFTSLLWVSLLLASPVCAEWIGFHPLAYTNGSTVGIIRFPSGTQVFANVWAGTNVVLYTNYPRPNVSVVVTSRFLHPVVLGDYASGGNVANPWTYMLTRWTNTVSTNTPPTTNWYPVELQYKVTNLTTLVQTSVNVQARDVWAIDAHRALAERGLGATAMEYESLYTANRELCEKAKQEIASGIVYTYSNPTSDAPQSLVLTSEYAAVGAPSNYHSWTSYRMLGGTGTGMGRYVTNWFTITGTNATMNTNYSYTACGDSVTLVGTNGQIVSTVCTNADIAEGFTELDYGWKYVPALLKRFTTTWAGGGVSTNISASTGTYFTNWYNGYGGVCANISDWVFDGNGGVPDGMPAASAWREGDTRLHYYRNSAGILYGLAQASLSTGAQCEITEYLYADAPTVYDESPVFTAYSNESFTVGLSNAQWVVWKTNAMARRLQYEDTDFINTSLPYGECGPDGDPHGWHIGDARIKIKWQFDYR